MILPLALALLALPDPAIDTPDARASAALAGQWCWTVVEHVEASPWGGHHLCVPSGYGYSRSLAMPPGLTRIVWHHDRRVRLSIDDLVCGTRIRFRLNDRNEAVEVEVITLGPLAMDAAVETWVAQHVGVLRAWTALSPGEMADLNDLASPRWRVRHAATERLRTRGLRSLRVLCWAAQSEDQETRERARGMLRELGWEGR